MTFHLPPSLAEHIRTEAARLGVSQSELAIRLIRRALEDEAASVYDRVAAGLEAAVDRGIRRMADRVAYLTARAALEAAQARVLLVGMLAQQVGREKARTLMDEARARAARDLSKHMDEHLRSILSQEADGGGG